MKNQVVMVGKVGESFQGQSQGGVKLKRTNPELLLLLN